MQFYDLTCIFWPFIFDFCISLTKLEFLPEQIQILPFTFNFDNLFTNFSLLAYLQSRGYNATGTIRENPKLCSIPNRGELKNHPRIKTIHILNIKAKNRIAYKGKKWWSTIFTWLVDACMQKCVAFTSSCTSNIVSMSIQTGSWGILLQALWTKSIIYKCNN